MSRETETLSERAAVREEQTGLRLDQAAAELFTGYSRARLQKWIRSGALTVDGRPAKPTYKVTRGERLALEATLPRNEKVRAQDIPLSILFEDQDLIVLDKAAGRVVHPAVGNPDGTLQNALLHFDANLAALPRGGIVHRLDKDTSGVMVVARSLRAHTSLVEQLQSRRMSRIYRAVASGDLESDGTVDAPIGRHPVNRKRMAVVRTGRPAVSHYRVLRRFGAASHLEVSLETGRTHQIRVHMKHIGHPLVGDPVYGRAPKMKKGVSSAVAEIMRAFPRQALHARKLKLTHPGDGREMAFRAPLPEDFRTLVEQLESAGDEH